MCKLCLVFVLHIFQVTKVEVTQDVIIDGKDLTTNKLALMDEGGEMVDSLIDQKGLFDDTGDIKTGTVYPLTAKIIRVGKKIVKVISVKKLTNLY